ncbi:STAS domain-containing protein [Congregibacter sp.]|uniref:STAS domain-containing protein n=1 Tax=Congregibacter sp. TaxID=2744308 RepID=UPI003F6AB6DF
MNLDTQLHEDPAKSLLRVSMMGGLNTDTAPGFEAMLNNAIAEDWQMVLLDMQALDYVSSAGLRVIFKAAKQLKSSGRSLAVANRQPQIEKVFEILQALPDMAVFTNDAELDEYLDAMQAKARNHNSLQD